LKLDKITQTGVVKYAKPDGPYGAGFLLEGHKYWLNFEQGSSLKCPNAGDEIEYTLDANGKVRQALVVGKKKVELKNVDVSMKAYLEHCKQLWSLVSSTVPGNSELALIVYDKALAPFKYWVDNKLKGE